MTKLSVSILVLVALCCLTHAQDSQHSGKEECAATRCDLSEEDYAVFAGLLTGLHGPEDPEEAWEGKEILILDKTANPPEQESQYRGWGFRSKSNSAPSQETLQDFKYKTRDVCTINPGFGQAQSYKIISNADVNKFFRKGNDGWKEFYQKHPKSAGYWRFSRPGYNPAGEEALLYVVHSCGWLCGTGHLYLLSKENGQWTVKNRLMLWIS